MLSQVRSILENDNDMRGFHYSDIEDQLLSLTNKVSDLEKTLLILNKTIETFLEPGFLFLLLWQ